MFKIIYKPLSKRAMLRAIVDRDRRDPGQFEASDYLGSTSFEESVLRSKFTAADVKRMHKDMWRKYDELSLKLTTWASRGAADNEKFGCLALAMHRALLDYGVDRKYSYSLTKDSCCQVYKKAAGMVLLLARIVARNPKKQIQACVKAFQVYPFSRPGYNWEIVPDDSEENAVYVRWTKRCPFHHFLRQFEEGEEFLLIAQCEMDYSLAELWGGWFDRPCLQAIEGAEYCDMRFNVKPLIKR